MSIFSIISSCVKSEYPTKPFRNLLEESQEIRKKTEEIANKIHPKLGKKVKQINNFKDSIKNLKNANLLSDIFYNEKINPKLGDHFFVERIGYTHHGIYTDYGVIHYLQSGIDCTDIYTFAQGKKIHIVSEKESPLSYSKKEAVKRAESRIGEKEYNILINNCENFVRWCRNGTKGIN